MPALSMMLLWISACQTPAGDVKSELRIPRILEQAFHHRAAFDTSAMVCRIEQHRPGYAPRVRNLESRWAHGVLYEKDFGDDDGFLSPLNSRTGELPIGMYGMSVPEERILDRSKGEVWRHPTNGVFFIQAKASKWVDYVDIRTYGLRSIDIPNRDPDEILQLFRADKDMTFGVMRSPDSPFVRVVGKGGKHADGGYYEYEWEIDTEKGPEVLLSREHYVYPNGRRIATSEVKSTLAEADGVWWPVELSGWTIDGGRIDIRYSKVEFNRPDHPQRIDLETLKIPTGAPIHVDGDKAHYFYLGGGNWTDEPTWLATRNQYDLTAFNALKDSSRSVGTGEFPIWWNESPDTHGLTGVSERPDLWEAYVRRWIIKHTDHASWKVIEPLSDSQKTAAKGILDDCRRRAVPIRAKLDHERAGVLAELAALEKPPSAVATSAPTDTTGKSARPDSGTDAIAAESADRAAKGKRIEALRARAATLEKSSEIERLFDELKRRLEGLLTSKQVDPNSGRIERPKPPPPPVVRGPASVRPATPTTRPVTPGR